MTAALIETADDFRAALDAKLADPQYRRRLHKRIRATDVPVRACSRCHAVRRTTDIYSNGYCRPCQVAYAAEGQAKRRAAKIRAASPPIVTADDFRAALDARLVARPYAQALHKRLRDAGVWARVCGTCRRAKPSTHFASGGYCQPCRSGYSRQWRVGNPGYHRRWDHDRRNDPATRDHVLALQRLKNHRRRALLWGAETDGHTYDQLLDYWVDVLGVAGCADCLRPFDDGMEIDHIVPLARGGSDTLGNKLPLCRDCHASKLDACPYAFYADRFPSLAPALAPFIDSAPKLTDAEVQARVDAYDASR